MRSAVILVVLICGCATAPQPAPVAAPANDDAHTPENEHTFVSTSNNDTKPATKSTAAATDVSDCTVTTSEAAKSLAESAVAEHLDPLRTWTTSPVLPATWPTKAKTVVFFFYPMAANPKSMTHFQLFSAAWRVEVSLQDGTTAVAPIAKPREIGTITQSRPSSLERRELEIAETALVQQVVGTNDDGEESPYWGYLKYMHEHPQLGKDLQRRSPAFLGWVRKRYGK